MQNGIATRSFPMISREDFIFTVGYEGNTAIVNSRLKRTSGRLSAGALAEKGLFKAAIAAAVYDNGDADLALILEIYNGQTDKPLGSTAELKRTFGVLEVFDTIDRVMHA
jgi:hypothetical protein